MVQVVSREKKLYQLTSATFDLVNFVDHDGIPKPLAASYQPTLYWPDGRWCFPATLYMAHLVRRARSRRNHGGTLHTYATQLSHLLRFCYRNRTDMADLSDNQFTLFVRGLSAPSGSIRTRNPNSVRAICHVSLNFLQFVGDLYGIPNFISPQGVIRAEQVERKMRLRDGRHHSVSVWEHHAIPLPEPFKTRLPIAANLISALRKAAVQISPTSFIRKRRLTLLLLLEITGGRRAEIAELSVRSVREAAEMAKPMLELVTLKGRGANRERKRLIPVARHDIDQVLQYIQFYRDPLVKQLHGSALGDGHVIVSESTGRGLQPNTITQEIWALRRETGLEAPACAHMFRHRYCTKIFVGMIEQHKASNEDEFRRMLISRDQIKAKVLEWTGHASLESLDRYIHLAFDELAGNEKAIQAATLQHKLSSFKDRLHERALEATDPLLAQMIDSFLSELSELSEPSG